MSQAEDGFPPARTLLEQKIRERQMTYEEFARFAEAFAAKHGEAGTLSPRHLQRLAAGIAENGRSLGRPRPATARLLERILGASIERLLKPPAVPSAFTDAETELRQMLHASSHVDASVLALLSEQLAATRRLDRQLGAVVARDEVVAKVEQVRRLLDHSVRPSIREALAAHMSELCTLAGWQALDLGETADAWRRYSVATSAAAGPRRRPRQLPRPGRRRAVRRRGEGPPGVLAQPRAGGQLGLRRLGRPGLRRAPTDGRMPQPHPARAVRRVAGLGISAICRHMASYPRA